MGSEELQSLSAAPSGNNHPQRKVFVSAAAQASDSSKSNGRKCGDKLATSNGTINDTSGAKTDSKNTGKNEGKNTGKNEGKSSSGKNKTKADISTAVNTTPSAKAPNQQTSVSVATDAPKKGPRRRNRGASAQTKTLDARENAVASCSAPAGLNVAAKPFVMDGEASNLTHTKECHASDAPTASSSSTSQARVMARPAVARPKPKIKENSDLRATELNQLRMRFLPTGFHECKTTGDGAVAVQCVLPITDPDFPFDLPSIRLEIVLPRGYPGTRETPVRPVFRVLNSDLPGPIVGRIERNMRWGLGGLEGGQLVCRPMLRHLEKHLEAWMVDDVREAAFQFLPAVDIKVSPGLPKQEAASKDVNARVPKAEGGASSLSKTPSLPSQSVSSATEERRFSPGDWLAAPPVNDQSSVGGNSYTLAVFLSVCRGIDLLTSQRLCMLVSCDRCKFSFPVEDLRPFVDRIEHCPKCTAQTKFYYKAQLVTPGGDVEVDDERGVNASLHVEGILGTVRMVRAKPLDLLPSRLQCACSRCYGDGDDRPQNDGDSSLVTGSEDPSAPPSGEGSFARTGASSCKIAAVRIGEHIGYTCFRCHQRIRLQISRVEWRLAESVAVSRPLAKKSTKDGPMLSVGSPLPQNGACVHYKKSFRWYRFPCCGLAFPCDECHATDPHAKTHPVEWATRFICGFCSREQPISVKECPECGKDTSAAGRKKSAFWEGGKGARNQTLMSRKDSKKYKDYSQNSVNSTTVKKKQT